MIDNDVRQTAADSMTLTVKENRQQLIEILYGSEPT
jgi:hypothetical protein